jgi:hypothetical protein
MKIYNHASDLVMGSELFDRRASRLARMRVRVWWGIQGVLAVKGLQGGVMHMLTLTYKRVGDWMPDDISGCMQWARRHGVRAYVWVAELQERGAVHYHVLVLWPKSERWVKPIEKSGWARGWSWVTPCVRHPFYLMKYLQKGGSDNGKEFPRNMRLYGVSQYALRCLEFTDRQDERLSLLPRWFVNEDTEGCSALTAKRVSGGVRWGGMVAVSPYSRRPLPDIDQIAGVMYTVAWAENLLPAK